MSRATDRSFQIIGEATKKIPQDFKDNHDDIPWKQMAGMRDVIVHEYDEIDIDQVWEAVKKDIPETLPKIKRIIEEQSRSCQWWCLLDEIITEFQRGG